MKYKLFFFSFFLLIAFSTQAQRTWAVTPADSAKQRGDLKKAIAEYRKTYAKNPNDRLAAFHLAALYATDRQADSAFKYLFLHLAIDSSHMACTGSQFVPLRQDKRWIEFENKAFEYAKIKAPHNLSDPALTKKLWAMNALDQQYYYEIRLADKMIGDNSPVSQALWDLKEKINSKNAHDLDSIIKAKGWPKISVVGKEAASAAFLVVQHSSLERQKKYLPVIKKLCQQNEAKWEHYALMYDRVQTTEGKPQLYGSQVRYNKETGLPEFFPIEDEKNVDKRRAEMGLDTLAEYGAIFGIKYEPKK